MYLSMLLFGKAGAGKSILASTFPKPLILDADGGHKIYKDKNLFPDATYVTGDNIFAALTKCVEDLKQNGKCAFETIVIDSLTNLENMAITGMKGMNSKSWNTALYSNKGKKLGFGEWGDVSGSTIAILTELRKYPINVVIITQLGMKMDGGVEKYYPELVGKGANESLHFSDIVGFLEVAETGEGVERILHLSSTANDKFTAKARLGVSEVAPLKNPNYAKLIKLVNETKTELNFND